MMDDRTSLPHIKKMQSAGDFINFLRRRGGIYLNQARRSLWIHARVPEDFEAARPILRWFRETVEADRFVLTSSRQRTCAWLGHQVFPPRLVRVEASKFCGVVYLQFL